MDARTLQKISIFPPGVDHLRHRVHALHRIAALVLADNLPAQGERTVREQVYASGTGHSKSFGLQPQLLRALPVAVAKPGSKAMLLTPNNSC